MANGRRQMANGKWVDGSLDSGQRVDSEARLAESARGPDSRICQFLDDGAVLRVSGCEVASAGEFKVGEVESRGDGAADEGE